MGTDEKYFAGAMLQAGEPEPLEPEPLEWEPWDGGRHWPQEIIKVVGKTFMNLDICQGYRVELSHLDAAGQPRARLYLGKLPRGSDFV